MYPVEWGMHMPFLLSLSVILLGYLLKRSGFLKEEASVPLSKIILNLTLPALILLTIARAELSADFFVLPFLSPILGSVSLLIGWLFFRKFPLRKKGVLLMGTMGMNIGLFAFPIIEGLYGERGVQIAALVDVGNAIMIFGVSYLVGAFYSREDEGKDSSGKGVSVTPSKRRGIGGTLLVFLKSVPFMSYFIGLAINFSGWKLPEFAVEFLEVMGKANQFLVLLVLGLVLSFNVRHLLKSGILPVFLIRYGVGLIFVFGVWFLLPIADPMIRKVAALCMILPVGFAVVPFAVEFDYDRETAGGLVNFSLVISFCLMWLLAFLL